MTQLLLGAQILLALLVVNAWLTPRHLLQWKFSLLVLELGHWLALLALLTAVAAAWNQRWLLLGHGLILAAVLMLPAVQAACLGKGMSWSRLWFPSTPSPTMLERREYWRSGQESLDVVIYKPQASAHSLPCIVLLHSGGWENGEPGEFESANRAIAAQGIAVLSFGYRLAPMHQWPAQREDVVNAVRWTRDHAQELGINPDQLFLMGRSAGGQIASAAAFLMPELQVRGCIAFYAPHDLIFAHQFSREDDILNALTLLRQYLGGDPDNAADNYLSSSAYHHVTEQSPLTLMLHGPRDALVWVLQSRRLTEQLKQANVAHEFLELPWAVHGCDFFPSSPSAQIALTAVRKFVHKHKE
jgi:acetyl esterase/lipase